MGGQADQVGVLGRLEPSLDVDVVVGAALDPARAGCAHPEVEDGGLVLRVLLLPPDLDQRAETEGLGVVLDDHGDGLDWTHAPIVAEDWQKINQRWHFCH